MMDFTKIGNQSIKISSGSINTNSCSSAASSITSCTTSSIISSDSISCSDSYSLSFITDNKDCYSQLLEDLTVIDGTQHAFYETNSGQYDKQIIDIERHISFKRKALETIRESELCYINDFRRFETFGLQIKKWLQDKREKDAFSKFLVSPANSDLDTLILTLKQISSVHELFLIDLKKRLEVWGPTQIISDLLDAFKSKLSIYDQFMENHPKFVMLLDALYKLPGFKKFMYATLGDNSDKKEVMDGLLHYIHIPLHRLNVYIRSLKHIIRYSDRSHPDYYSLLSVSGNFKSLEKKLSGKVNRCQSHLIALESILSIADCPLLLTMNLRLLLFAQLIKIDLDDPSATSDVRMYFLYNDTLIFCKKAKEKKGGEKKLEYKETINLSATTVRLLSPEYLAKMCEVKKPMFRIGKKTAEPIAPVNNEAFGFELVTTEFNVSGMAVPQMEYDGNGLLNGITSKRRHAIRTRSLIEQNIWVEAIYKAIRAAKSPIS